MSHKDVTNIASADALLNNTTKEEGSTNGISAQGAVKTNSQGASKKKSRPNTKRRGGVAFSKAKIQTSLQIAARLTYFPIFVSNFGVAFLSEIVYNVIRCKDYRIAVNITVEQLTYVTNMAFINRCVQCAVYHGYALPTEASRLKQATAGIQLPSVLADFIEAIGLVVTPCGLKVTPHVTNDDRWINNEYMRPARYQLIAADRPIPNDFWNIDIEWIQNFNSATTRASRSGIGFRRVNNDVYEGRNEMLVSYLDRPGYGLEACSPVQLTSAEAQLGATYRFRDYEQLLQWPGEHKELVHNSFLAMVCDPNTLFNDLCVAAFKGANISLE